MTTLISTRREPVGAEELRLLRERGTVVLDEQRRRPRYFDGRFLAARDLTREQDYFLSRQAALGQMLGAGVASGLQVERGTEAGTVRIAAGFGLTPGGELVALDADLEVRLAEVAESDRLNAAFGLRRRPQTPARSRTGLYVLGLRPVEFTANPVASYPATLAGPRTLQDGDVVEAVAVTLVPWPGEAAGEEGTRRARLAREVFVHGVVPGLPAEVLPLAVLALERGTVRWADPFLVRRELGARQDDLPGLGLAPRALREAHLVQYELHLRDVLDERRRRGLPDGFAASEHFLALPPAGGLPLAAIDATDFSQIFFPPEVEVELSLVPEDEVPALLRDSLVLPPLDLTAGPETFAAAPQLVLVPVERERLRQIATSLVTLTRTARPAAPGRLARQTPVELLRGLSLARPGTTTTPAPGDPVDEAWRAALAGASRLWFVRRRLLSRSLARRATTVRLTLPAQTGPIREAAPAAPVARRRRKS